MEENEQTNMPTISQQTSRSKRIYVIAKMGSTNGETVYRIMTAALAAKWRLPSVFTGTYNECNVESGIKNYNK